MIAGAFAFSILWYPGGGTTGMAVPVAITVPPAIANTIPNTVATAVPFAVLGVAIAFTVAMIRLGLCLRGEIGEISIGSPRIQLTAHASDRVIGW